MRRILGTWIGAAIVAACSSYGSDDPALRAPDAGDASSPQVADAAPDVSSLSLDSGAGTVDAAITPYAEQILNDSPVAYWRMNIVSGVVPNVIFNAPALVPDDITQLVVTTGALPNEDDHALQLGGAGLIASDIALYDFTGDRPFTVECWAKMTVPSTTPVAVLAYGTAGTPDLGSAFDGYALAFEAKKPVVLFGNSLSAISLAGLPIIEIETWHHYASVVEDAATLYVDGARVAETTLKGRPTKKPSGFSVGSVSGASSSNFFGVVDEVAIYDRVLSEERIAAHFGAAH